MRPKKRARHAAGEADDPSPPATQDKTAEQPDSQAVRRVIRRRPGRFSARAIKSKLRAPRNRVDKCFLPLKPAIQPKGRAKHAPRWRVEHLTQVV